MNGSIHIFAPRSYYIGQLRGIGCRRWRTMTGRCRSSNAALVRAVRKASRDDKRVRTLLCSYNPYLEPLVYAEGKLQ